ncbi:MAG: trypsin-like serine protease [Clostridia bacterium]|nr:trypsin-like serine protease [Clostridia bacterium]
MNNYPLNSRPDPQQTGRTQPAPWRPKKRKKHTGAIIGAACAGVAAGVLVMSLWALPSMKQQPAAAPEVTVSSAPAPEETPAATQIEGGAGISITNPNNPVPEIAETAGKSVVSVQIYNRAYVSGQQPIDQAVGAGSGFVISDDGLIMTNHHVVEGGNRIQVVTADGKEYEAEVVGSDPNTEVALLRVQGLDLPALPLGNSDEARTGEMVIAVGNPINESLNGTVTVGYLSGVGREMDLNDTGVTVPMLQTDAAINPGNSGGPLLNSNGEVIGITTMKTVFAGVSDSGNAIAAEGIGYAVPITTAMNIANQILETGSVPMPVRPGIGFTYRPVDAQDAQMWGVPQGIMIAGVASGSPADRAGLREQDVIVSLDGVDLTGGAEVPTFESKNVGDVVSAVVWRSGRTYDVEFVLADLNSLE